MIFFKLRFFNEKVFSSKLCQAFKTYFSKLDGTRRMYLSLICNII